MNKYLALLLAVFLVGCDNPSFSISMPAVVIAQNECISNDGLARIQALDQWYLYKVYVTRGSRPYGIATKVRFTCRNGMSNTITVEDPYP